MTADTARSRPKARLVALVVSSMRGKTSCRPNETERGEGSQPVKPCSRIGFQLHLALLGTDDHVDSLRAVFDQWRPHDAMPGASATRYHDMSRTTHLEGHPSFVSKNLFDFSLPVPVPGGLQEMLVRPYQRSFAMFEGLLLPLYQSCS